MPEGVKMTRWLIKGLPRECFFTPDKKFRPGHPGLHPLAGTRPIKTKPPPHNDNFRDARGRFITQPPWVRERNAT